MAVLFGGLACAPDLAPMLPSWRHSGAFALMDLRSMRQNLRLTAPRARYVRLIAGRVRRRLHGELTAQAVTQRMGVRIQCVSLGSRRGTSDGDTVRMNCDWPWRSEDERRWVLAEELGHHVLKHGDYLEAADAAGDRALYWQTAAIAEREATLFAETLRRRPRPKETPETITAAQRAFLGRRRLAAWRKQIASEAQR